MLINIHAYIQIYTHAQYIHIYIQCEAQISYKNDICKNPVKKLL